MIDWWCNSGTNWHKLHTTTFVWSKTNIEQRYNENEKLTKNKKIIDEKLPQPNIVI